MPTHYPKHHRSPLHELLNTFQLSPHSSEKIEPVRLSPKWTSDISTTIATSKKEAIKQVNQGSADAYIYTDGSALKDGGVGASAVLCRQGRPNKILKIHLGDKSKHTVYEAELVGILLAIHLLITIATQISSVLLGVDNQAAIITTKKITSGPAHYIADEIHKARRRVRRLNPELGVGIRWTPGHVGIQGNEMADAEAKKAALGESSPTQLLPTLLRKPLPDNRSAVSQDILTCIKRRNAERLKLSPRYAKLLKLDPKAPSGNFMKMVRNHSKRDSAILMYLRTGHAPLNKHLFRIGKSDTPRCPYCPRSDETVFHFLVECPEHNNTRRQFWDKIPVRSRNIINLLSNPKMTKATLDFIYHTKRIYAPRASPDKNPG
ncbi:hypothetical protein A0H81_14412 [Grifola frondosa]|uniref:ribonuclease H n=1 Tax=Grifola frondosa TaxID=5627 RepID=A0A1C7LMX2_GRIFR|nr:hypothetical protein A0H81_14412 [Grifola frondosa]